MPVSIYAACCPHLAVFLATQAINTRLEEVLENKNMMVKALQYDVAKVSKAHNDLINVYEAKVRKQAGSKTGWHAKMQAMLSFQPGCLPANLLLMSL